MSQDPETPTPPPVPPETEPSPHIPGGNTGDPPELPIEGKEPDHVRVAGRKEMDMPPRRWDIVDEQSDESFPASDPPGNY